MVSDDIEHLHRAASKSAARRTQEGEKRDPRKKSTIEANMLGSRASIAGLIRGATGCLRGLKERQTVQTRE